MLGAILDGCHGQHLGPDLEHEITDFFAHGHAVEHVAQLNGVLDRQGFLLLDLLRQGGHAV